MEMSDTDCGFPGEERQEREAVCSFYSILVRLLLLIGGVECNPGPLNQSNEVILFNRFIFPFLYRLLYTYGIHHLHLWREILVWNLSVVKYMSPVHCPFLPLLPLATRYHVRNPLSLCGSLAVLSSSVTPFSWIKILHCGSPGHPDEVGQRDFVWGG